MQAINDFVLIKRTVTRETTESGIFLPKEVRDKPNQGTVISCGKGKMTENGRQEMPVKVGDTVLFARYQEREIEVDGEKLLVVKAEDLLGVIEYE